MPRNLIRLAAIVAGLATAAGCGLGGGGAAGPSAAPAASASGAVTGTVSFQTWALKPKFTEYVQGVIDGFEKRYPGVKVEWIDQPGDGYAEKLLSQASTGQLPDVTNIPPDFAYPLVKQGLLLDVGAADPKIAEDYVPGGVDGYKFAGYEGTFGYPWYLNTDVNYWNSELMSANGLDPKQPPTNLDELIAQAKIMQEKSGGKVYLMSRKPVLMDLVNAGVPVLAPDGRSFTFNTPEAAAILDKYREAFKEGLMPRDVLTSKYQGNAALFNSRTVAWTTGGGNYISSLAVDNPSLAPKVVPTKAFGTPPLYVQGLSIPKNTKNLPAALALARWVTNAENQAAFAHLVNIFPSTKASANDPFFSKSDGTNSGDAKVIAFESLSTAKILEPVQATPAMRDFIDQQFALAISGKTSSKEALDAAVEKCNQLLNS
jgi:multiple sugar transport system substrate-binding protein